MWLCRFIRIVKGTITITGAGDDPAARQADERNKGVTFKNCVQKPLEVYGSTTRTIQIII